jgi:hypothetical protein
MNGVFVLFADSVRRLMAMVKGIEWAMVAATGVFWRAGFRNVEFLRGRIVKRR